MFAFSISLTCDDSCDILCDFSVDCHASNHHVRDCHVTTIWLPRDYHVIVTRQLFDCDVIATRCSLLTRRASARKETTVDCATYTPTYLRTSLLVRTYLLIYLPQRVYSRQYFSHGSP